MGNNFNSPAEVVDANIAAGKVKANLSLPKMILLGILAGFFIAIGDRKSVV